MRTLSIKNVSVIAALALALLLVQVSFALASAPYTLFGDASVVAGGNPGNAAEIVSDITGAGFGGVSFPPAAAVAWLSLATLSADYNVTDDNCGGGSPRIQLGIDTTGDNVSDGTVHIAIGPSPSFTGCAAGWQSTGNLVGNNDAGRYDFSQFGGSPFTTYSNAPASVQAGSVVRASIVVDGYWSAAASGGDNEQTVLVDNLTLNADVVTFDPEPLTEKEQCKNGGWADYGFKNQGQCVRFVETGKDSR